MRSKCCIFSAQQVNVQIVHFKKSVRKCIAHETSVKDTTSLAMWRVTLRRYSLIIQQNWERFLFFTLWPFRLGRDTLFALPIVWGSSSMKCKNDDIIWCAIFKSNKGCKFFNKSDSISILMNKDGISFFFLKRKLWKKILRLVLCVALCEILYVTIFVWIFEIFLTIFFHVIISPSIIWHIGHMRKRIFVWVCVCVGALCVRMS